MEGIIKELKGLPEHYQLLVWLSALVVFLVIFKKITQLNYKLIVGIVCALLVLYILAFFVPIKPIDKRNSSATPQDSEKSDTKNENEETISEINNLIKQLEIKKKSTEHFERSVYKDTTLNNIKFTIDQLKTILTDLNSKNNQSVNKGIYDYPIFKNKAHEILSH